MTYVTVRDAVLTQLRAITGFSTANVTDGDWEPLNAGQSKAVVINYDGYAMEPIAFDGNQTDIWTFKLRLYNALADDILLASAAEDTDRAAIIARFRAHPRLGGALSLMSTAFITRGAPVPTPFALGASKWLVEDLTLEVREEVDFTESE